MLGWLDHADVGGGAEASRMLLDLASELDSEGVALCGAVEESTPEAEGCEGKMTLTLLGCEAAPVVISQDLGAGATSCRLDAGALEQAVQQVIESLPRTRLVIVNKFGKQEATGRGMVAAISAAMQAGLPVLTAVAAEQRAALADFAGGLGARIPPDELQSWCRHAIAKGAA